MCLLLIVTAAFVRYPRATVTPKVTESPAAGNLAAMKNPCVLAVFSAAILVCFAATVIAGAAWLLPLSGLFMSVIYPTINSRGISSLPKSDHGSGAAVVLFFTCVSAVLAPLAMGAISDKMGNPATASCSPPGLPFCCSPAFCSTGFSIRRLGFLSGSIDPSTVWLSIRSDE
jgi:fucose permease